MPKQPTVTLPRDLARAALTALAWNLATDDELTECGRAIAKLRLHKANGIGLSEAGARLHARTEAALAEIGEEGEHDAE